MQSVNADRKLLFMIQNEKIKKNIDAGAVMFCLGFIVILNIIVALFAKTDMLPYLIPLTIIVSFGIAVLIRTVMHRSIEKKFEKVGIE